MTRPLVVSAVPTAFNSDGSLDLAGTGAIIRHAIDGGVDFVFINGTTAEFPALNRDERAAIVAAAIEIAGADRVIAHIGGSSAWEAVAFTDDAVALGAVSLAAITPFYLPASQHAIHDYFGAIREAAPHAEIYAYLFPDRTAVHVNADEVAKLVSDFELSGVKVSIPGVDFVSKLVGVLPRGPRVFSGNDGLLTSVHSVGGAGIVSGVSSAVPWPFVAMADVVAESDALPYFALQADIDEAVGLLGPSIARLKLALKMQGIIADAGCRMAIDQPNAAVAVEIQNLVEKFSASRPTGRLVG